MAATNSERVVYVILGLGPIALLVLALIGETINPIPRLTVDGATTEGVLSPTDASIRKMVGLSDDAPGQQYQIMLPEAGRLSVLLTSNQFDPYVMVYDPRNKRIICRDDDSGGSRNALCVVPELPAGNYLVLAKASDRRRGAYRLQATFGCPVRQLAVNATVAGELSRLSCPVREILRDATVNSPAEQYRITIPERGALQVDLQSNAFDAYLVLMDGSRRVIATDDDSGGGRNARVALPMLEAGEYTIVATTAKSSFGPYQLQTLFQR